MVFERSINPKLYVALIGCVPKMPVLETFILFPTKYLSTATRLAVARTHGNPTYLRNLVILSRTVTNVARTGARATPSTSAVVKAPGTSWSYSATRSEETTPAFSPRYLLKSIIDTGTKLSGDLIINFTYCG